MIPIKFCFEGEVRRVALEVEPNQKLTFEALKSTACTLFSTLEGKEVTFIWNDDDGDCVHCSTDEEIREAIRVMDVEYKSAYRFDMKTRETKAAVVAKDVKELPVHRYVSCDGCGVYPIVGSRFKCTFREDYDLCETCEAVVKPPYPMIKIYDPAQTPVAITVKIRENGELVKRAQHCRRVSCRRTVGADCECGGFCPKMAFKDACSDASKVKTKCEKTLKEVKESCVEKCIKAKESCEQKITAGYHRALDASIQYDKALWKSQKQAEKAAKRALRSVSSTLTPLGSLGAVAGNFVQSFSADRPQIAPVSVTAAYVPASSSASSSTSSVSTQAALPGPTAEEIAELEQINCAFPTSVEVVEMEKEKEEAVINRMAAAAAVEGVQVSAPGTSAAGAAGEMVVTAAAREVKASASALPIPYRGCEIKAENNTTSSAGFNMRVLEDVTIPDGSVLVSGQACTKQWRVRNVGEFWWVNVNLVSSGGDDLVPPDSKFAVPMANAGEDIIVSLPFVVPSTPGRHVTYFRFCKDGKFFGQRLWVDFRVDNTTNRDLDRDLDVDDSTEEENDPYAEDATSPYGSEVDWQIIGQGASAAPNAKTSTSTSFADDFSDSQASTRRADVVPSSFTVNSYPHSVSFSATAPPSVGTAPAPAAAAAAAVPWRVGVNPFEPTVASAPAVNSTIGFDARYAAELVTLGELGFTDRAMLLPLLDQHVGRYDTAQLRMEGVERIVNMLMG